MRLFIVTFNNPVAVIILSFSIANLICKRRANYSSAKNEMKWKELIIRESGLQMNYNYSLCMTIPRLRRSFFFTCVSLCLHFKFNMNHCIYSVIVSEWLNGANYLSMTFPHQRPYSLHFEQVSVVVLWWDECRDLQKKIWIWDANTKIIATTTSQRVFCHSGELIDVDANLFSYHLQRKW